MDLSGNIRVHPPWTWDLPIRSDLPNHTIVDAPRHCHQRNATNGLQLLDWTFVTLWELERTERTVLAIVACATQLILEYWLNEESAFDLCYYRLGCWTRTESTLYRRCNERGWIAKSRLGTLLRLGRINGANSRYRLVNVNYGWSDVGFCWIPLESATPMRINLFSNFLASTLVT